MFMKAGVAVVLGVLATAPAWAADGPFGISMGTRLKDLDLRFDEPITARGALQSYAVKPPTPNAQFDDYVVKLTEATGACEVIGFGNNQVNDDTGAKVSAIYASLQTALSKKYGAPTEVEEGLESYARLTGRNQFAASLKNNQRELSSVWEFTGSTAEIARIWLYATSLDGRDTQVNLVYEFENYNQCTGEKVAGPDDAGL